MPLFINPTLSVGFTGTEQEISTIQGAALLKLLTQLRASEHAETFHHGDCIGADEMAHQLATSLGFRTIIHPPTNPKKRAFCIGDEIRPAFDYLVRNCHIVNDSDLLLATPKYEVEELRSGTWSTVRYARKLQRPIYIIMPDGRVETERMAMMPI